MGHTQIEQTMTYMHLAPNPTQGSVKSYTASPGYVRKLTDFVRKTLKKPANTSSVS
jgi:hypothetical protein